MKKKEWVKLPVRSDKMWIGEFLISSFAVKFYCKHKRWPKKFRKDSVICKGRTISMELE